MALQVGVYINKKTNYNKSINLSMLSMFYNYNNILQDTATAPLLSSLIVLIGGLDTSQPSFFILLPVQLLINIMSSTAHVQYLFNPIHTSEMSQSSMSSD